MLETKEEQTMNIGTTRGLLDESPIDLVGRENLCFSGVCSFVSCSILHEFCMMNCLGHRDTFVHGKR